MLKATRSSAALLALAALALVSVTALSLQAWYAWEQQRLADARMRDNIAVIATRNFTSRVGVVITNYVGAALEPLQQQSLDERQLRARLHDVRDSLAQCACQTPFQIASIRVVDTAGVAFDGAASVDSTSAFGARVRRAARDDYLQVYFVERGTVAAIQRLRRPRAQRVLIAEVRLQPNNLADRVLPYAIDSMGPLVPRVLTGRSDNRSAFAFVVRHGADTLYKSATVPDTLHMASQNFGADSAITFTTVTSSTFPLPSVARAPNGATPVLALALATVLAVVASTALALRSAQLSRMQGDFAASVSHELRTPLTEIVLFAELLESGRATTPADVQDAARLIRTEARRLHHMVDNVLHMNRGSASAFPIALRSQRVHQLLDDVLEGFEPIAAQRECVVDLQCTDNAEWLVDASALRQVLLNLLDNAVRYGPEQQRIHLRLARAGTFGVIEVDDGGPGIPKRDRTRVLEPYVRLERDVTRARTGTGLGLSVVSVLVRQMHGRITISASSRGGALVAVFLPLSSPT